MERKEGLALRVILLGILVSYTDCKVVEEPNHLIAESSQGVTGSALHADIPLRTRQHKFPIQISTITDAFSSDVERIGSLDDRGLQASKNVQKSIKWDTDNKIRNVSAIRKLKFAMRRLARRHNVLKSSLGTAMPSPVSILKDGKDMKAFGYEKTSPSSITSLPYKTDITVPVKLMILPTKETSIPSVATTDVQSDWISKQDNSTKQDDKNSAHSNGKDDKSSPHGEPKATKHEGPTREAVTSAMPRHKLPVHPGVKASSRLRWKAAYDHVKLDDSKKGKHSKISKKKSHSEDEQPVDTSSTAATVAGILAGIVISFIFIHVRRLWRTLIKRWRRRSYREFGSNFFLTDYSSEELSEEEIIFDRSVMECNMESSQGFSPRTQPEASLGRSRSATSCYESPGQVTQEHKLWTLTDAPRSTPLRTVPTLDETPRTEFWMSNEIPKSKYLNSLVTTTSLSPTHDLTDKSVPCVFPFATQTEQTTSESSLLSNQSAPNLSFLPTTSEEFTGTGSMATENIISSTKSCKTPVAARNEVVVTIYGKGEITYTSNKSQNEVLSVVQDAHKESVIEKMVLTMGLDDDKESLVVFESESETSLDEIIYTSQTEEMKNVTSSDVIIDIMGNDNDIEKTSAINEKSNQDLTAK